MNAQQILTPILCLAAAMSIVVGPTRTRAQDSEKHIRIIYTNDTLGHLEPCGCGGRYEGGLARRATAIARLVRMCPDCLIIDSGNLARTRDTLGITCRLMARMGYCAVGIGNQDLRFREEFLKQTAANGLVAIDPGLPKSKFAVPYLVRELDGVKVGVVSYNASSKASPDAFRTAYQAARRESDVLILLDQGGIATDGWLQANAPEIVIGAAPKGVIAQERTVGRTHIAPTSMLGRRLGVADIQLSPGQPPRISAQMLVIDKNTAEDASIEKQIESFLLQPARQAALKGQPQPWGKGKYTSPETCKRCHTAIYNQWRRTKHAAALATLISKNRMIPDCLPCHSEQYRQTLNTTRRSSPTGIECATCHADMIPHGIKGPSSRLKKANPRLCLTCHTPERSPDFDIKTYLSRISHHSARH